ncbi:hypothetical protein [Mucilaginibacter ginsenosidivorax]|uniref:Uncharacterized protein n=1 Tax=Mucilaginibacter ginsenosidivorax TaxID=862126 RepID=A0A5B8W745_9SPHI|nr:hypothetical protein [Mucilaginibacter ginsenosidivorax]QEC78746.1 hypothetical protein FSB76_23380 [Mucilaginibacter ginsenosidivorax]
MEKKVTEMNEDELNKFHNDSIIDKYGLADMAKVNVINEWVDNFPKAGTYAEKRAYLEAAAENGTINTFSNVYKEGEEKDNCSFSILLYDTDDRLIID